MTEPSDYAEVRAADAAATSAANRAYLERRLSERLLESLDEVALIATDRTSPFLILIGLAIVIFGLGWRVLAATGVIEGLDVLEFLGVLAAGIATLITGAFVRRAIKADTKEAVTAVTSTTAGYINAMAYPGPEPRAGGTADGR